MKFRNPSHAAIDLSLPLAISNVAVEIIRIRNPFLKITFRILTTDKNAVSGFRPEVDCIVSFQVVERVQDLRSATNRAIESQSEWAREGVRGGWRR